MTEFLKVVQSRFLQTYRIELANAIRVASEMDNETFRQELTRNEPDKARILEGETLEERRTKAQELAMSVAVAEAIRYAFEIVESSR